jgi:NADPH-dependent 7-cyano-7-deazaguanine reductase QueF
MYVYSYVRTLVYVYFCIRMFKYKNNFKKYIYNSKKINKFQKKINTLILQKLYDALMNKQIEINNFLNHKYNITIELCNNEFVISIKLNVRL